MKTHIQSFLLMALIGLIAYHTFFTGGALQQARALTESLHTQVDTLRELTVRYERIHQNYQAVHEELLSSHVRATHLSDELSRLATTQQTDVQAIQHQLRLLMTELDTLTFSPLAYDVADSLFFRP